MKLKLVHIGRLLTVWAMLFTMGWQIANRGLWNHQHRLANGQWVAHAHPMLPGEAGKHHTHHGAGWLLWSATESFDYAHFLIDFRPFTQSYFVDKCVFEQKIGPQSFLFVRNNRAPPLA